MRFLSLFSHQQPQGKGAKQNILARIFCAMRDHLAIIGMSGLVILLLGVLLFDGFVFYANVLQQRQPPVASEKKSGISEKELADTMRLIDDRQKEFDGILNNLGGTGSATSSPTIRAPAQPTTVPPATPRIRR